MVKLKQNISYCPRLGALTLTYLSVSIFMQHWQLFISCIFNYTFTFCSMLLQFFRLLPHCLWKSFHVIKCNPSSIRFLIIFLNCPFNSILSIWDQVGISNINRLLIIVLTQTKLWTFWKLKAFAIIRRELLTRNSWTLTPSKSLHTVLTFKNRVS